MYADIDSLVVNTGIHPLYFGRYHRLLSKRFPFAVYYRGKDAKGKASTMRTYWVPGVNHLNDHGHWAFAEFADVYAMQEDFAKVVAAAFDDMIHHVVGTTADTELADATR